MPLRTVGETQGFHYSWNSAGRRPVPARQLFGIRYLPVIGQRRRERPTRGAQYESCAHRGKSALFSMLKNCWQGTFSETGTRGPVQETTGVMRRQSQAKAN